MPITHSHKDFAGTECFTIYDGIKVELAFILVFTLETLSFFKFFTYKVFNLPNKLTSDNILALMLYQSVF